MVRDGFTSVVPTQRVTIYANSQEVHMGNIGNEYSAISFQIPLTLVQGRDTLDIKLELMDATSSASDPRGSGYHSVAYLSRR